MIKNPAYASAKKYSRYSKVRVDKYIPMYESIHGDLKVPWGYTPKFKHEEDRQGVLATVPYPKFKFTLRDTQKEAYDAYIEDTTKAIVSLPTGKGKSILGLYTAYALRQKTIVIVHKNDLINGWTKDIRDVFGHDTTIGLIQAKNRIIGDHITLATVQTLNNFKDADWSWLKNQFGFVIVDEFHHCPANTYRVVENFNAEYRLGLSATPERNDGLGRVMHLYFGPFAYVFETKKGEIDTDILPVEVKIKNNQVEYVPMTKKIKAKNKRGFRYILDDNGDTPITDLPHALRPKMHFMSIENALFDDPSPFTEMSKDLLHEYTQGRSVLVFFNQKEHCRLFRDFIVNDYVPEEEVVLYYGDSIEDSSSIVDNIENGKYKVTIATYKKATEGTNVKKWEVALLGSSLNNGMNTEQAIGRIRRTEEGKNPVATVYDYRYPNVYQIQRHGNTRDVRYRKLHFKVTNSRSMFSRGYSNRH